MSDSNWDWVGPVMGTAIVGGALVNIVDRVLPGNGLQLDRSRYPYKKVDDAWERKRPELIGKTQVKVGNKVYKRYKAGSSPTDKQMQKEMRDPKYFPCECDTKFGGYHLLGCDCEDCPICKGQLLSCGHGSLFETQTARCN